MCGFPSRLKRMRSIAPVSVAVPTVERGSPPIRSWSTMIAVVSPSMKSTSGRASVGMKPCTKALYVSLIIRCDSAAIVLNTNELLPEPETPVNTVSRRFGSSTLTSLRLFTRAPTTRIRSWLSLTAAAADCASALVAVLIGPPGNRSGREAIVPRRAATPGRLQPAAAGSDGEAAAADRPGARALSSQDPLGDGDLLALRREVGPRGVGGAAVGVPRRLAELQPAVVAVAGVDAPVAARLAPGDGGPVVAAGRRVRRSR